MKYWPITVEVDGRRIEGDWTHWMGGRIHVRSIGYGSDKVDLGDEHPDRLAHQVLEALVRRDQQKQAEHAEQVRKQQAKYRRQRLSADRRLAAQLAGANDPMTEALGRLVEQIEGSGYRDQHGHSLETNEAYIEVRQLLDGYAS